MFINTLFVALLASSPAPEPLPDHTDIPDGFSTVICPDQNAAKNLLDNYYTTSPAPNNYGYKITVFFEGLKATGCTQKNVNQKGVITIKQVMQRKILYYKDGDERLVRYIGTNSEGTSIAGIVNEDGNNKFYRTPLAEWKYSRTQNGWLVAPINTDSVAYFYRCDTPQKADAAVKATQGLEKAKSMIFDQKLAKAAAQQGCRRALDVYYVTALLSTSWNDCGDECDVDLTALSAIDRSGLTVGLIFYASEM